MTIGNLEFDPQGEFCLASTDKKFVAVVCFDGDLEEHVGQKKSTEKYLLENYGSKRPGHREIMKTYKDIVKNKQASTTSGVTEQVEPIQTEEPKKPVKHYKKGKRVDGSSGTLGEPANPLLLQPTHAEAGQAAPHVGAGGLPVQRDQPVEAKSTIVPEKEEGKKMAEEQIFNEIDQKRPKLSGPTLPASIPEKDSSRSFLPTLPRLQDSGVWQNSTKG